MDIDEFRRDADLSNFDDGEEQVPDFELSQPEVRRQFLGMSPAQRFAVALMLFFVVCLVGTVGLLVTEKVVLPGLF